MNYFARILNSVLSSKAQCQQLVDERGDGCTANPESKGSKHQRDSSPLKQSNHQHYVGGSGWRRVSAIMDSGSAECVAPEDSMVTYVALVMVAVSWAHGEAREVSVVIWDLNDIVCEL